MPIISSMAAVSSRGYGQFRTQGPGGPFGTLGAFRGQPAAGEGSNSVSVYSFAPATMRSSSAMASAGNQQAFGTRDYAIYTSGGGLSLKYTFNDDTAVNAPGATMTTTVGAALSNGVNAIVTNSGGTNGTRGYAFASDLTTIGPGLTSASTYATGAGNRTLGFITLGGFGTAANKYTYATNIFLTTTSARVSSAVGAACGDATFGIFAHGSNSTATDKRTYASEVVSAGSALKSVIYFGSACGNNTYALFSDGGNNETFSTSTYVYATGVTVVGTLLVPAGLRSAAAASNGVSGVNV